MAKKPVPSLNALRTFDSAARNLNFVRASEELFVSQGAISKQMRNLEEIVGVKLFERASRGVRLTENGDALLICTRRIFADIDQTIDRIGSQRTRQSLHIAAARSYSTRVLAPRIKSFVESYPWIELHIDGYRHLADLHRGEADAAIRVGEGDWPNHIVESLGQEDAFPVCSPSLLLGRSAALRPEDLLDLPLLHYSEVPYWSMWFRKIGLDEHRSKKGIYFTETVTMLGAAEAGQGVSIARSSLVQRELNTGVLLRLFDVSVRDPRNYYFVATEQAARRPAVKAFREWLMSQ